MADDCAAFMEALGLDRPVVVGYSDGAQTALELGIRHPGRVAGLVLGAAIGLGGLPLLFTVAPAVGRVQLFGINLPWLLLGVAAFPFLVAVGWAYVLLAQRNEQDFTDLVARPER